MTVHYKVHGIRTLPFTIIMSLSINMTNNHTRLVHSVQTYCIAVWMNPILLVFPPSVCNLSCYVYDVMSGIQLISLKSIRVYLSPGSSCGLVAFTLHILAQRYTFFMGHIAIF